MILLSISRHIVDGSAGTVGEHGLKIDSMCLLRVRGDLYELEELVNR